MSRNVESRFSTVPTTSINRSRFPRNSRYTTSFNVGDIIPFYLDEVLPGDTFSIDTSLVCRLTTLLTPVFDNLFIDIYYYFVPNRLTWEHWQQFQGENTESAWVPTTEYAVPQISPPEGGWQVGTIADYFGLPTGVDGFSVMSLPFRAYALIMQEWFRDENLTDPLNVPKDDVSVVGVNTDNYITDVVLGGAPFKASKYHDYFTSALPAPQKGPDVTIPISSGSNLPVIAGEDSHILNTGTLYPLRGYFSAGSDIDAPFVPNNSNWISGVSPWVSPEHGIGLQYNIPDSGSNSEHLSNLSSSGGPGATYSSAPSNFFSPTNLYAVDDGLASSATINQLRLAFQIQKLLERDARSGTRYIEILKAHFGITSPDSRLQRPEYLGGSRLPVSISQVIQNSETDQTPQGNTAAYSLTTDYNSDFTQSFTEHGFVIGLAVARYPHTYQQGVERFWSRKTRYDFYMPVFANIGEQGIRNMEIFCQGTAVDLEIFGYQEAWAEYRYKVNKVTGQMRSQYVQSLDLWHFADDYSTLPTLSDEWIRETPLNVDRALAVTSAQQHQILADFYIKNSSRRPMPINSVPGLIDHN